MNSRLIKVLLSVAVVVGGLSMMIYSSVGSAQYYKMVDELMVEPGTWVDKDLRVHGYVEAGSIKEKIVDQKTLRTFYLQYKGKRIKVSDEGPKPDTFKDLSEVVAEGRLAEENGEFVLYSDKLMAKCPSKYEGAAQNKNFGTEAPAAGQPVF